jgi:signal transduction histidine kinase
MSVRRNLFLIYKEILHNIVKHSHCTKAGITVGFESGQSMLAIQVRDNGRGFDPVTTKRGNGLNNIEKRAGLLRAKVQLTPAAGSGSAVRLLIPLKSPL